MEVTYASTVLNSIVGVLSDTDDSGRRCDMTEHKAGSRDHGWAFVLLLMIGWLVSALVATYYFRAVLDTIGG